MQIEEMTLKVVHLYIEWQLIWEGQFKFWIV